MTLIGNLIGNQSTWWIPAPSNPSEIALY